MVKKEGYATLLTYSASDSFSTMALYINLFTYLPLKKR